MFLLVFEVWWMFNLRCLTFFLFFVEKETFFCWFNSFECQLQFFFCFVLKKARRHVPVKLGCGFLFKLNFKENIMIISSMLNHFVDTIDFPCLLLVVLCYCVKVIYSLKCLSVCLFSLWKSSSFRFHFWRKREILEVFVKEKQKHI